MKTLKVSWLILTALLLFGGASSVHAAAATQRTFSSTLAVTIPDHEYPVGLAFGTEAQPAPGYSEIAVLNQNGNVSFVGPAPLYYLNGSISAYGISTASYSVSVGFGASMMIYVPQVNTFYVLNNGKNSMTAFEGEVYMSNGTGVASPRVVANLTSGAGPLDECYTSVPGGDLVYVLNYLSQSIGIVNATTNQVAGNLTVREAPLTQIACGWNGALFSLTSTGLLAQLNATTGAVIDVMSIAGPDSSLTFDPNNGLLYAVDPSDRTIQVVNPQTLKVVDNITTSATPGPLAVDAQDDIVFASAGNQTIVLDGTTNAVMGNFSMAAPPYALAVDTINSYLYAAYEAQGAVAVFAFSTGTAPQTVTTTSTSTARLTVTTTSTTTATEVKSQPVGGAETVALLFLLVVVVIETAYLGFGIRKGRATPGPAASFGQNY